MRKLYLCCLKPQRNVPKTNKKKLKVSEVLAQLDTDVLIREVMGAIKVLVVGKEKIIVTTGSSPVKSSETKP